MDACEVNRWRSPVCWFAALTLAMVLSTGHSNPLPSGLAGVNDPHRRGRGDRLATAGKGKRQHGEIAADGHGDSAGQSGTDEGVTAAGWLLRCRPHGANAGCVRLGDRVPHRREPFAMTHYRPKDAVQRLGDIGAAAPPTP